MNITLASIQKRETRYRPVKLKPKEAIKKAGREAHVTKVADKGLRIELLEI